MRDKSSSYLEKEILTDSGEDGFYTLRQKKFDICHIVEGVAKQMEPNH